METDEALVVGDTNLLPNRIKIDVSIHKPKRCTPDFWNEWQQEANDGRIAKAIQNWIKQNIQQCTKGNSAKGLSSPLL
ncbi:hypothetical protein ACQKQC_26795 [Vibrio fortis]|uniref:hypothetical protein n=1 Tax=Vibrio TaxID=662 RepID=UPI0015F6484C|nr:hypothetical protein [Vibrio diabolicus]